MIMTKAVEAKAKETFGKIPASIQTTIQNASVMLSGSPTPKGNTFTGSGVILWQEGLETWVLTAKHNLFIFNDSTDPPTWSQDLVDRFATRVRIYYDGPMKFGMQPAREARITRIVTVPEDAADWSYDVVILKSEDADLRQFAMVNAFYKEALQTTEKKYLEDSQKYLSKDQTFIVTGFGESRDKSDDGRTLPPPTSDAGGSTKGALQYRITSPFADTAGPVYLQRGDKPSDYTKFECAILLSASEYDSTAPGDSGGPLFVVFSDQSRSDHRVFLIGVTTGSDMATSKTPCPPLGTLRANNVATSLKPYYSSSLRFG